MSLITDLQTFLRARPLVAAAVGTHVYEGKAPQGQAAPYIVYQELAGQRDDDLEGGTALARPVYQIVGWTTDPAQLEALSSAIRSIKGYRGAVGGTTVYDFQLVGSRRFLEPPEAASNVSWQSVGFDYAIWFEEPVPS